MIFLLFIILIDNIILYTYIAHKLNNACANYYVISINVLFLLENSIVVKCLISVLSTNQSGKISKKIINNVYKFSFLP